MMKQNTGQEQVDSHVLFHLHHIERVYSLKAISPSERWNLRHMYTNI